MGPSKGMPDSMRAAEAELMARTSWGFTWSAPKMVPTMWTSLRKPLGNDGRSGPVDEPAGQDGLVGGLALPAEERAGDLAGGVGALLDVDGEREEVRPLAHRAGRRGRGQEDGVADAADDGAVGQLGQLACFEAEGLVGAADGRRNGNGVGHDAPCGSGTPRASSQLSATPPAAGPGDRQLVTDLGGSPLSWCCYGRPRRGGRSCCRAAVRRPASAGTRPVEKLRPPGRSRAERLVSA